MATKDPELCQWADCLTGSMWGLECCRAHRAEWTRAVAMAQEAALDYGDSTSGHWDRVDADPLWRSRWWEPQPEGRRPIPWGIKRLVAQKHGGQEGTVVAVACPRCGAAGEIHWQQRVPRFVGMHVDHIRPVSKGGGNDPENLRLLCPTCNIRRGNREVA
jgi:hypothetical protein